MQNIIAVVTTHPGDDCQCPPDSESLNVHQWFTELQQRIAAFQDVHIVIDTEFGPCDFFRTQMQRAEFADSIGAQVATELTTIAEEYRPLFGFKKDQTYGNLGSWQSVDSTDSYNTSHIKLGKRPYDPQKDAKNPISYFSLSPPVQAKVYCATFRVLHYISGQPRNEDFIFPLYLFQNPADTYGQCANTIEDERALLRYMAEIWCQLLEKAARVYSWGSIDITLPLEWFVLNDVFVITLKRRNQILTRLGWKIGGETKFVPGPQNIYHNVTTSLCSPVEKGLQKSIDHWIGNESAAKLLCFEDLDLLYALSSKMSTDDKMPDTNPDYQKLTFCKFDRLCEAVSDSSLLKYNHRDVVLVCKLLRKFCTMITDSQDQAYQPKFRSIHNRQMEHIYEGDCDSSVPVTLVCCRPPSTSVASVSTTQNMYCINSSGTLPMHSSVTQNMYYINSSIVYI